LYSEFAPAGGAEPRRMGALTPLAAALVAVLASRAAATVAVLGWLGQRVSERVLTDIERLNAGLNLPEPRGAERASTGRSTR